jgi:hypothetical protein
MSRYHGAGKDHFEGDQAIELDVPRLDVPAR